MSVYLMAAYHLRVRELYRENRDRLINYAGDYKQLTKQLLPILRESRKLGIQFAIAYTRLKTGRIVKPDNEVRLPNNKLMIRLMVDYKDAKSVMMLKLKNLKLRSVIDGVIIKPSSELRKQVINEFRNTVMTSVSGIITSAGSEGERYIWERL